ncbi:sigma factor-like helix-turn-helix DNA-binding protein [Salarchaeum sp. JOR-1]|uniref:sigma factor-like helix-turn-helix DNA-binding protein n=1 Tax=Salarchaeum sp. JOR-1 TaxID=2599399 RepID=UPI001198491B|nr:sigma factor-like helix-turn-helix DNA-binding protein [Salarchaeum sp. JOR-1]QDX39853.1 RNA polymerase subunit sigma-24 [Salarchaeum sp. JOR-1]
MSEQATLATFAGPALDELTEAERDAYQSIREGEYGVREFARETDRAPGTVGNLLARADAKLGGS